MDYLDILDGTLLWVPAGWIALTKPSMGKLKQSYPSQSLPRPDWYLLWPWGWLDYHIQVKGSPEGWKSVWWLSVLLFPYSMLHLTKSSDPHSILRPPYRKSYALDTALQSKISRYFSAVMNGPKPKRIRKELPKNMPSWGKVRIAGGGDRIRAAVGRNSDRERNMSYVRVSLPIRR